MPRVSIAGGSVGGLTAALVLRDAGCDVRVFERSSTALQARGAGIAALDTTLDYLLTRGGFQDTDVCSSTGWIRFLNRDGSVQHEQRHRYRFSSWNTIYRSLLSLLDAGRYVLGTEVTGFAEQDGTVTVSLGPKTGPGTHAGQVSMRPIAGLRRRRRLGRPGPVAARRPSTCPTPGTWPGAAPY
jgi:2,6-dihydroxypyridine 3-monooxygenase